jgi:hypothetical protein
VLERICGIRTALHGIRCHYLTNSLAFFQANYVNNSVAVANDSSSVVEDEKLAKLKSKHGDSILFVIEKSVNRNCVVYRSNLGFLFVSVDILVVEKKDSSMIISSL